MNCFPLLFIHSENRLSAVLIYQCFHLKGKDPFYSVYRLFAFYASPPILIIKTESSEELGAGKSSSQLASQRLLLKTIESQKNLHMIRNFLPFKISINRSRKILLYDKNQPKFTNSFSCWYKRRFLNILSILSIESEIFLHILK